MFNNAAVQMFLKWFKGFIVEFHLLIVFGEECDFDKWLRFNYIFLYKISLHHKMLAQHYNSNFIVP